MGKDTTAFKERFNAYKNGKSVSEIYDAGLPRYAGGKPGLTKAQLNALDELYEWGSANGLDITAISGIGGNGIQESSLDSEAVSKSGYAGLWQNNKNLLAAIIDRYGDHSKKSLLAYAKAWINGEDWVRKGKYAAHTAMGSGKFKKSGYKTAEEASDAWMKQYERPVILDANGKIIGYLEQGKRRTYSKLAYDYLNNKYGRPILKPVAQTPITATPDAVAVRPTIPAEQTVPAYDTKISPYISGKPMVKLRPRIELPNLMQLIEDSEWEPPFQLTPRGYKNGKLPGYKDGTRYLWDDQKGEWDRITDSDVADAMALWAFTPTTTRAKFDYENTPNPIRPLSKNAEVKQDNDLWTRLLIEKANNTRTWRSDIADQFHNLGEASLMASNFVPFESEMIAGANFLTLYAKSYLTHPFYKKVYHGSPVPFDIKNAWTATPLDLGLHVTPNKLTSIEAARAGTDKPGFVYKLRIPKENALTIDIGNNGVGHLYLDLFMDSRINTNPPGFEPSAYYDTTPGDIYRFSMLEKAGANPSLTDATHLQTQNPVYINLRELFSNLTPRQQRIADQLVNRHKLLLSEEGYVPNRNILRKEINQEANDLLRNAGYKVIKYHNANPYEGGGGTAYMITDPNVIDVLPNTPNTAPLSVPTLNTALYLHNKIRGYKDGKSPIHIKPANRGKFTALKKRTGHSASWFKENGTPAQKKMAVFALNAKKWKH